MEVEPIVLFAAAALLVGVLIFCELVKDTRTHPVVLRRELRDFKRYRLQDESWFEGHINLKNLALILAVATITGGIVTLVI